MTTCQNCHGPHATWRCPELWSQLRRPVLTCDSCLKELPKTQFQFAHDIDMCICDTCYHEAMNAAPIQEPEPETLDRIFEKVMDRLAHPHPCSSCGDLTAADVCAACWEDTILDRIVHTGLVTA